MADNAHLLVASKDVGEIIQNLQVAKRLTKMVCLKYFIADVRGLHIECDLSVIYPLLSHLLQFIEGLLAVTSLMTACLRHTAHPLQLRTVEVIGPLDLHVLGIDPFLPFLEVVAVVALVAIERLIVNLDDLRADAVEKVAVVRYHQEGNLGLAQVLLQPLGHLQVKVVGRLVEHQEVGLGNQRVGQCHPLELPTRKVLHLAVEIINMQL